MGILSVEIWIKNRNYVDNKKHAGFFKIYLVNCIEFVPLVLIFLQDRLYLGNVTVPIF